jgi:peroxiredoxin family protein
LSAVVGTQFQGLAILFSSDAAWWSGRAVKAQARRSAAMLKHSDAAVELLAELVKERLQDLRRELQEKVEQAIRLAACNLSHELMAATESRHDGNGHLTNDTAVAGS